jgi:hypothetical protein
LENPVLADPTLIDSSTDEPFGGQLLLGDRSRVIHQG